MGNASALDGKSIPLDGKSTLSFAALQHVN
jgi:hypothetical protein